MGYRHMTTDDLYEIFRRWHRYHTNSSIKDALGFDRNTIRNYINLFETAGFFRGCELPEKQKLMELFRAMLPLKARKRTVRKQLEKHREEIINLITRKLEPVKPKTAFLIIQEKYGLSVSYGTFKLFVREHVFDIKKKDIPLRIELPPGKEIQLDYGRVGLFYDSLEKRNRIVWAFCGKLSFSRLPYIEFVYSQNQETFVASNINMLEFFGGTTEFLTTDNLKAAVIKPDLYDPKLNHAYAEFAEHYGTFINPCRVGKGDDKGKVERMIPQARELFRRLKEVHPTFNLRELNEAARGWCLFEYGKKKHGTTGVPPVELFKEERQHLKSLPETRFEIPEWKEVTVSSDRFFSFKGKYYAMPADYRGKKLNVRKSGRILRVFDRDYRLLREYIITKKMFSYLPGDFADDKKALMNGEYPRWLMGRAHSFGPATARLIESVLKPHAYINARRARGILTALEKYRSHPFLQELCNRALKKGYFRPKQIIRMFEAEKDQQYFDFIVPVSETGKAMIRDVKEYFN